MLPITEQVIITLVTALCAPTMLAVVGIIAVRNKNRAVADRERVEADNKKIAAAAEGIKAEAEKTKAEAERIKAEAEKIKIDAETRLTREKSEASQGQQLMQLFQQQITINQQSQEDRERWWKELQNKEKRDESNYRILERTQQDNTQMLLTEIQNQSKSVAASIQAIPVQVQEANGEFVKALSAKIIAFIADEFEKQRIEARKHIEAEKLPA